MIDYMLVFSHNDNEDVRDYHSVHEKLREHLACWNRNGCYLLFRYDENNYIELNRQEIIICVAGNFFRYTKNNILKIESMLSKIAFPVEAPGFEDLVKKLKFEIYFIDLK